MRRCVAPAAIAASKSPLIPAEMIVAVGVVLPQLACEAYEVVEVRCRVLPERGDRHEPAKGQVVGCGDRGGQLRYARGHDTRTSGIGRVEVDLDEAWQRTPGRLGPAGQRVGELDPVDTVDHVGVAGDGTSLVGLQPAEEMTSR